MIQNPQGVISSSSHQALRLERKRKALSEHLDRLTKEAQQSSLSPAAWSFSNYGNKGYIDSESDDDEDNDFLQYAGCPAEPELSQKQIQKNYVEFILKARQRSISKASNLAAAVAPAPEPSYPIEPVEEPDEAIERAFLENSEDEGWDFDEDDADDEINNDLDNVDDKKDDVDED